MKNIKNAEKYYVLFSRRLRKSLKRRNALRAKKKRFGHFLQGKSASQVSVRKQNKNFERVRAPEDFVFLTNPEEVIYLINKIETFLLKRKKVFVILQNVKKIDHGAIVVLLSLMRRFKESGLDFNGDFPFDSDVRKKLIDSQFFERLMKSLPSDIEYEPKRENQIFVKVNKKVVPEIGKVIMEETAKTIWGEKRICKGLQRAIVELMHNTNNHASSSGPGEERWWLSVNHDKTNRRVTFSFVDYGQGILRSLESGKNSNIVLEFLESARTLIRAGSGQEILRLLFEGRHLPPERRYYRGKGLPSIKVAMERGQIANLNVITNNVSADVKNSIYKNLGKDFNGTFFCWELNSSSANEIWKI